MYFLGVDKFKVEASFYVNERQKVWKKINKHKQTVNIGQQLVIAEKITNSANYHQNSH